MAYRPPVNVGRGTMLPRTGPSFARARLVLAQRAGYLPQNAQIASGADAIAQWRSVSKNLATRARGAGFMNPLQWLRQGATTGELPGTLPPHPPMQSLPQGVDPRMMALIQSLQSRG